MDHFITTLRQLYSIKINWEGTKYIGMDININRKKRHVTISMPGHRQITSIDLTQWYESSFNTSYILLTQLQKSRSPNYNNRRDSKSFEGTKARAPISDRNIIILLTDCRSVNMHGSPRTWLYSGQAKPTIKDRQKMERLLQYTQEKKRYHQSSIILVPN
jgi:hypothetical protein